MLWHPHLQAANPYVIKLSVLDDELALNVSDSVLIKFE